MWARSLAARFVPKRNEELAGKLFAFLGIFLLRLRNFTSILTLTLTEIKALTADKTE